VRQNSAIASASKPCRTPNSPVNDSPSLRQVPTPVDSATPASESPVFGAQAKVSSFRRRSRQPTQGSEGPVGSQGGVRTLDCGGLRAVAKLRKRIKKSFESRQPLGSRKDIRSLADVINRFPSGLVLTGTSALISGLPACQAAT